MVFAILHVYQAQCTVGVVFVVVVVLLLGNLWRSRFRCTFVFVVGCVMGLGLDIADDMFVYATRQQLYFNEGIFNWFMHK